MHVGGASGAVPLHEGDEGGPGQQVQQSEGKPQTVLHLLDCAR